MSHWQKEEEPYTVMNHINEFFDYDHYEGRLRWTANKNAWERLPAVMKRQVQPGAIAGTVRKATGYDIVVGGARRKAIHMIWEHQTGVRGARVMTIAPDEYIFRIDNLCLLPLRSDGKSRRRIAPAFRAADHTVVSWSYERKQFTVVEVDDYYNKVILSYHSNIEDAIEASKDPEVSFL